jgi:hypothetical protein
VWPKDVRNLPKQLWRVKKEIMKTVKRRIPRHGKQQSKPYGESVQYEYMITKYGIENKRMKGYSCISRRCEVFDDRFKSGGSRSNIFVTTSKINQKNSEMNKFQNQINIYNQICS